MIVSRSTATTVTVAFLLVLTGLGVADALTQKRLASLITNDDAAADVAMPAGDAAPDAVTGVSPANGPDVAASLQGIAGIAVREGNTESLLAQLLPNASLHTMLVADGGDYAGSVTWMETADAKATLSAVKDALLPAFSPQVSGLQDITDGGDGGPVRNIVRFSDPALSVDAVVLLRVRNRLLEIHVAAGHEEKMEKAIEALSQ
ncbi:MAG: hypothetical protein G01um101425_826 [Candidatus Peregrinibacteria bacterium Gr01-1014_25]|nr:MAG: hypothetical protein G01um101425_826 [Candidatus Peregrinibacteria bacterium Gr01-1014_25]